MCSKPLSGTVGKEAALQAQFSNHQTTAAPCNKALLRNLHRFLFCLCVKESQKWSIAAE